MKLTYLPDIERIKINPEEKWEYLGIKKWLSRRPEGYVFDTRFKLKIWDGYNHGYDTLTDTIPLGLWREAYKCCQELGYPFNFENKEEFPINKDAKKSEIISWMSNFIENNNFLKSKNIKERDYQLRVAASVIKDRYCNISVATSGGKTFIYSLIIFWLMTHSHKDKKFLLVVPSKTLVTQFFDDLLAYSDGQFDDLCIQEIFSEKARISNPNKEPNLIISTFQSLGNTEKYPKKWFKQFWSITCDEGHKSASATYRRILKATFKNSYYRWGMSGTFPKDESEEMMQIMMNTGPVIEVIKAKELMDKGYITKVKIKGILLHHQDYEFAEQLEIISNRDKKACYDLEMAKVQESESRLLVINKIVKECTSNTLVLFHNTEYGQKIFDLLQKKNPDKVFHYIDGSISNKNRTPIKLEMQDTTKVHVLVASFGTLSTGVSIDSITNVIFTQSFKKAQIIIQSIGRALRLHKDKKMAYIFDLVDIFDRDPDIRYKAKFKNILAGHWDKRTIIYNDEEYPYTTLKYNL